jgi:hypothetical protein
MKYRVSIVGALACALLTATAAEAKVLNNAILNNAFLTFSTTGQDVPLTDAGATVLAFSLTAKSKIMFTYSAECASTAGYGSIQIIVDNVAIAPTAGTDDAFCTSSEWVTASKSVVKTLNAGAHSVRIQATAVGGDGTTKYIRLDDANLIIQD